MLAAIRTLLDHTDWSNDRLLESASRLDDNLLDRDLEMGPGTLRRTMLHIDNGEHIWLKRWIGGGAERTPWPSEAERISMEDLHARFRAHRAEREHFLDRLSERPAEDLLRLQPYLDSGGTLYQAPLRDMLIQGVLHTKHHQAQAVNMIRRLGGDWPELDYMYRIRQSSPTA